MSVQSPHLDRARRLLPAGWDHGRDLAILFGDDCAELSQALAELGVQRLILFVSPELDLGLLPGHAFAVHNEHELGKAIAQIGGSTPQKLILQRLADPRFDSARLRGIQEIVRAGLAARNASQNTIDRFGAQWLRQGLANLPAIARHPSIDTLRGAFAGQACVIVAPGPSLDRNVHLLRELSGRALILTCTHAVRALEAAGVTPDLIMAADAGNMALHLRDTHPERAAGLVLSATAQPSLYELPAQRFVTFASNSEVDDWAYAAVGDRAGLETGGSVSCSALSFALQAGCDRIAFVGQDLAFTGERYYAERSLDGAALVRKGDNGKFRLERFRAYEENAQAQSELTRAEEVHRVPGWGGGTVETSSSFLLFLQWFERLMPTVDASQRVYNCTEGGAHIAGMRHAPLAEVLPDFARAPLDVGAVLDAAQARIDPSARARAVRTQLQRMQRGLEKSHDLAQRCARLVRQAQRDPRAVSRLDRAEKDLMVAMQRARFLSLHAQKPIREAGERAAAAGDLAGNLRAASELYAVVQAAAAELRAPIAQTLASLEGEARRCA